MYPKVIFGITKNLDSYKISRLAKNMQLIKCNNFLGKVKTIKQWLDNWYSQQDEYAIYNSQQNINVCLH